MANDRTLIAAILDLDPKIRYVAVLLDGHLEMREREGLANTSSGESDKYEELLVNPTVLDLVRRRGNIDCGGARFVVIRYGHFWQIAMACRGGHVSTGMELDGDPLEIAAMVSDLLLNRGL